MTDDDLQTQTRPSGAPWSLDQSATFLTVSRRTLDRAVKDGRLKTIRLGRRRLVPDDELRRVAACGLEAGDAM